MTETHSKLPDFTPPANGLRVTRLSGHPLVSRYKHLGLIAALFFVVSFGSASACMSPKPGQLWDKDDLIDNSDVIVVATVSNIESFDSFTRFTLIPIERVRGSIGEIYFTSHTNVHSKTDFNKHQDKEFWEPGRGRSDFPCCICGPDHTFKKGETYLLFPNAFGAWKSAEIIRNFDEDEWYKYVVHRVSNEPGL